jgi:hypothetical protein
MYISFLILKKLKTSGHGGGDDGGSSNNNVSFKVLGVLNEVLVWLVGHHNFSNFMYTYHQYSPGYIIHIYLKWWLINNGP